MEIAPLTESSMSLVLANMLKNGASFGGTMAGLLEYGEVSDWDMRAESLSHDWRWFTGEALEERLLNNAGKDYKAPLRWPLQINPFKDAARLHAFALWGMVKDNSGALVQTRCEPRLDQNLEVTDEARKQAAWADYVLADIDYENDVRAMDLDIGLLTQALGGVVLKVSWVPDDPMRPSGIRYDYYDPRNFYCRYRGRDFWNLDEAWIRTKISADDAKNTYGVKVESREATYLEYWNRTNMWVAIDGYPATRNGKAIAQKHDFGFVPLIYVPHERVNGFWGRSIVSGNIGLVKELNSRESDIGDSIHFGVNNPLFGSNIRGGGPSEKSLTNGVTFYDLGRNQQGEDPPKMERTKAPDLPVGTEQFIERLRENLRNALITPSIAYGEEEGSQRSGQTLYNRMWPLLSHVLHERINMATGRNRRSEYALMILAMKGQREITQAHLGLRKRQLWAPMVPVDRAALIDELVKRKQETMLSLEHALELVGDVPDIQEEIKKIWDDAERMAEIEATQTKMTLDSQEKIADKQLQGQKDLADQQAEHQTDMMGQQQDHQMNMADKQAKTAIQVAKSKPANKPSGGK
jgi:hypothetical protein